jgi:MFS family permease
MWTPVNRIILYGVFFNATRMLVGAFSALYLLEHGMTLTDLGLLKTVQAVSILVLDVPLAYLADRYSRKLSVVLAAFFGSLWMFLMALTLNKWVFYLAEFFNALSLALVSGALISFLIDVGKHADNQRETKTLIGRFQKYQYFSMGIAAFLGAVFIDVGSSLMWYVGSVMLTGLFFSSAVLPKDVELKPQSDHDLSVFQTFKTLAHQFKNMDYHLGWVALSLILTMAYYQILIQFWQPYTQQGLDSINTLGDKGIVYGSLFLLILVSQSWASHVAEKCQSFHRIRTLSIYSGVGTILIALIGLSYFPAMVPISIIAMFANNRLLTVGLQSLFHDTIPSRLRSTYDSFVSTLLRIVLVIILPIMGWLLDQSGWPTLIYFYLASLVGTLLIFGRKMIYTAAEIQNKEAPRFSR